MSLNDSSSLELSDNNVATFSDEARSKMFLGTPRQLCLRHCGFISASEAEVCSSDALQADADIHPAWGVLLQHSAMHTTGTVCRLLCTSRGVRASVMLLCKGTITAAPGRTHQGYPPLRSTGTVLNSLLRFLPRHGALVQALDLQEFIGWYDPASVMARALWEAKDSLCLQSLTVLLSCPALYQQVAAIASCRRHLIRLVVHADDLLTDDTREALSDTLRQLTELKSLTLFEEPIWEMNANIFLPALAGLTKLTYLEADASRLGQPSRHLPASLVELSLGAFSANSDPALKKDTPEYYKQGLPPRQKRTLRPFVLDLSHLTAVTKLDLKGEGDRPEHLYPCDKLPPNTQWLSLYREDGWAMLPVVLQLTCLTYLELSQDRLTAEELGMLHQLTTLQEVSLEARSDGPDDVPPHDNCLAWHPLPIRTLSLFSCITDRVLQQVAKLTRLTELDLCISDGPTGSRRELSLALQPLQQLQSLHLYHCGLLQPPWPTLYAPGELSACGVAIGGLRELTSLRISGLDFTRDDMTLIGQLRRLEDLMLSNCSIDDYGLGVIAAHLTGLTVLHLDNHDGIGDAVLPVVGQNLRLLKRLYLDHTGVTDLGVQWLRQLSRLDTLNLCGCRLRQQQFEDWKAVNRECCRCRMARYPAGASWAPAGTMRALCRHHDDRQSVLQAQSNFSDNFLVSCYCSLLIPPSRSRSDMVLNYI